MHIIIRLTSFKHNLRYIRSFLVSRVVVLTVSAAICSCGDSNKELEVVDAPSALKAHRAFLEKASIAKETDTGKLIALTKEWFVLSDTLSHHIQPDSVKQKVYDVITYMNLQDSVANRLEEMVDAEIRTFEDVLIVREALGKQPLDTLLKSACAEAYKFFDTLDMAQIPEKSKEDAVNNYTMLLKNHLKKGIRSKSDMQRFIRAEDFAFRRLLVHLHELGNTYQKKITNATESFCELILKYAKDGQM